MPNLILRLAYQQLAESTAIYAISDLSLCTLPPEQQLVPPWAPYSPQFHGSDSLASIEFVVLLYFVRVF